MAAPTRKRKRGLVEPDALSISKLQLEPNITFDLPTRPLQLAGTAVDPGKLRATPPVNPMQFEASGLPQAAEETKCGGGVVSRPQRPGFVHLRGHVDDSSTAGPHPQGATGLGRKQGITEITRIGDFGDSEMDIDLPPKTKKRQKKTGPSPCAPSTGASMKVQDSSAAGALFPGPALAPKPIADRGRVKASQKAVPAATQEPKPKARKKKRQPASTPASKTGAKPPTPPHESGPGDKGDGEEKEEKVIVEPIRAALTWQEDEITIYDPDDEDDDGRGINGVGFASTPAVEHGRVLKRNRQLENYKKALEGEERAKRSQRRRNRGSEEAAVTGSANGRKVRFAELELATDVSGQKVSTD